MSNDNLLWIDKYMPKYQEDCIGYDDIFNSLNKWVSVFYDNSKWYPEFKNAILLSGPPGIGKTMFAHMLLKKFNFKILEFNASELRTTSIICDKLDNILSIKSITELYSNQKTGIIMDELDGIEPKKEYKTSDILDYILFSKNDYITRYKIHLNKIKKKMTDNEIQKFIKKSDNKFINNCPIILITNVMTNSIQSLLKDVIHIKIPQPNDNQLFHCISHIKHSKNININDDILKICIPYCQKDYRRAIELMEALYTSFDKSNISHDKFIKWLNTFSYKDISMTIEQTIPEILYNPNLTINELINLYYVDESFIPIILHENFIDSISSELSYSQQLDVCLNYYEYLYTSLSIKSKVFGAWEDFNSYIAFFTTYSTNSILKPHMIKPKDNYNKSALISKYNYRYYNMKFINYICKKANIDIDNFAIFSFMLYYSVFINTIYIKSHLEICANYKFTYKELEKILKLCILYDDKKYNKKKIKELTDIYLPLINNLDLEDFIID
jgi:DNA polymerase III delta prime subunit